MAARALGVLLPLLSAAIALAWCGAAEAKTGLARVVVLGTTDVRIPRRIEGAVLDVLNKNGSNPKSPAYVAAALGLKRPTDRPTVAQCVAAGTKLGLDVIAVIRVRLEGRAASVELRVVTVADGGERSYTVLAYARNPAKGAADLVAAAFADIREWDTDLVDAEHALGRDLDEKHAEYAVSPRKPPVSFAEHMYLDAETRARHGKAAAIVVPTLFALTTAALVYALIARPWEPDERPDGEASDMPNMAAGFGTIFITALVGAATAVSVAGMILGLTLGLRARYRAQEEMARLRHLVPNPPEAPRPDLELALAPMLSPEGGGLALDLRF